MSKKLLSENADEAVAALSQLSQLLLDLRSITSHSAGRNYSGRLSLIDADSTVLAVFTLADAAHNIPAKILAGRDTSSDIADLQAAYKKYFI
jgi:voltage-gated potassium channel Kch